jgi:hypothetical protein
MADLTTIRTALAAQIAAHCSGLRTLAQARGSIDPPVAVILPGSPLIPAYGQTMDGALTLTLNILVIISSAAPDERVQRALDVYLGIGTDANTESIPNAIMADPTLGGTVHYCEPVSAGSYGRISYAGEEFFGCRITATVGTI